MALTTTLSFTVQNDNKLITINDTTADYGIGGNIAITDITALTLDVTVIESDSTSTTYDTIDLYAGFGPFSVLADMEFELDASDFTVSGTALGTSDTEFPDGIYYFTYTINTSVSVKTYNVLLDGRVVNSTYELLRNIPLYYLMGACKTKEIMDVIFTLGMIDSMESSAYVGNDDAILEQLAVIERLVTNGSSYTW